MKITHIPIRQIRTSASTNKATESKPTNKPAIQAEASVKSNNINSKLTTISDVDMDKVNHISALLADGKLTLDLDMLSDAMIKMHRR